MSRILISLFVLLGLLTPAFGPPAAAAVSAPAVSASSKPRATVAGSYLKLANGSVRVVLNSASKKVTLRYRDGAGRTRSTSVAIRAGHGNALLAAGATQVEAKAAATSTRRTGTYQRLPALTAPVGLRAAPGANRVDLAWSTAPGVVQWQVFRRATATSTAS